SRYLGDLDEPEPDDDEELDEEEQMARDAAIEAEDRRALTGQLVGDPPKDEALARAAWLGLVERASGRLSELAAAHEAGWESEAAELAEELGLEIGADEERLWRYQFGCERSLRRTLETLLKLRRGAAGPGRGGGGEADRAVAPTTPPDDAGGGAGPGTAPTTVADRAVPPAPPRPSPRAQAPPTARARPAP